MNTVIVDVDGTLAEFNPQEVHHWVLGDEKHWDPFFAHMADAKPIEPICQLVKLLKQQGQQIVICSGRPDSHRQHTLDWLIQYDIPFDAVFLRGHGEDQEKDEVVKSRLLDQIRAEGFNPWLVLDDRDSVVSA
ncbi:HAD family acid phosphatase [Nitrincola sp.]|uniref:phosphatase domain-containing protein n=1 Tax=Nitrincola sp. TaxID=1926584 RepID=UPI003A8D4447